MHERQIASRRQQPHDDPSIYLPMPHAPHAWLQPFSISSCASRPAGSHPVTLSYCMHASSSSFELPHHQVRDSYKKRTFQTLPGHAHLLHICHAVPAALVTAVHHVSQPCVIHMAINNIMRVTLTQVGDNSWELSRSNTQGPYKALDAHTTIFTTDDYMTTLYLTLPKSEEKYACWACLPSRCTH